MVCVFCVRCQVWKFRYAKSSRPSWRVFRFALKFRQYFDNICLLNLRVSHSCAAFGRIKTSRRIFLNKHFYFSILISLLIVSPNIYWQITNGLPTWNQLNELQETQLVNVESSEFLMEQVKFFSNSIFIVVAGLGSLLFFRAFRNYRFVGLSYVITLGFFILLNAKGYYAIGLYPAILAFGACWIESFFRKHKIFWRSLSIVLVIGLSIPFLAIAFPLYSPAEMSQKKELYDSFGMLEWEDGKTHHLPQDFADMLGWRELAQKTRRVYDSVASGENTLVICDNYGQAGAVTFYNEGVISAVSYNADYKNWFPELSTIQQIIYIKEKGSYAFRLPWSIGALHLSDSIKNKFSREEGTKIYFLKKTK